jgi:hypothetical protein
MQCFAAVLTLLGVPLYYFSFLFIIWFGKLLALRPFLAYCAASGDSEDDCGEADGM